MWEPSPPIAPKAERGLFERDESQDQEQNVVNTQSKKKTHTWNKFIVLKSVHLVRSFHLPSISVCVCVCVTRRYSSHPAQNAHDVCGNYLFETHFHSMLLSSSIHPVRMVNVWPIFLSLSLCKFQFPPVVLLILIFHFIKNKSNSETAKKEQTTRNNNGQRNSAKWKCVERLLSFRVCHTAFMSHCCFSWLSQSLTFIRRHLLKWFLPNLCFTYSDDFVHAEWANEKQKQTKKNHFACTISCVIIWLVHVYFS